MNRTGDRQHQQQRGHDHQHHIHAPASRWNDRDGQQDAVVRCEQNQHRKHDAAEHQEGQQDADRTGEQHQRPLGQIPHRKAAVPAGLLDGLIQRRSRNGPATQMQFVIRNPQFHGHTPNLGNRRSFFGFTFRAEHRHQSDR